LFINIPRTQEPLQKIYCDLLKAKADGVNFEAVANIYPVYFTCKSERNDFLRHFQKLAEQVDLASVNLDDRVWEIKVRNN